MNRCLLTFIFTLTLLVPFVFVDSGFGYGISTQIHDWTTPYDDQTANDPINGEAYKSSFKGHSASITTGQSEYWASSYSGVEIEVHTQLMIVGDESDVESWILVDSPS